MQRKRRFTCRQAPTVLPKAFLAGYYRRPYMTNMISTAFPYQKQRRRVLGREMAYVEVGLARQSHLVVPLAQRAAAPAAARPLHRPRPDRHGRLRQAANSGPGSYRFVEH